MPIVIVAVALDQFRTSPKIALAVSGGPDSMALAALAAEAIGRDRLIALVVDHQLNEFGVSEDSSKTQSALNAIGIASEILTLNWHKTPRFLDNVKGRLVMEARDHRYRALFDACKRHNSSFLLTGHNLEDDIVTMFYRMSRLSGLDGIAGMKSVSTFPFAADGTDSCFLVRPLLPVPKSRLLQTCQDRHVSWIHDLSNDDLNYRRNETLQSLSQLQSENPKITTEALQRMLSNFKKHRSFVHQSVAQAFSKSVILNQKVGDATLILNYKDIVEKKFLFNRVFNALIQFVTADPYPPKTQSLNLLHEHVSLAWKAFSQRLEKVPKRSLEYESLKRIDLPQHTLGGAAVYALSRNDNIRRQDWFKQKAGRALAPGPGLMIVREAPSRTDRNLNLRGTFDFGGPESAEYLWDKRILIKLNNPPPLHSGSLVFEIEPLSIELIKEFELLTATKRSLRKNLYALLGQMPASHLHIVPVLRMVSEGKCHYMAIPTINCSSDPDRFSWKCVNTAVGLVTGKFQCLP